MTRRLFFIIAAMMMSCSLTFAQTASEESSEPSESAEQTSSKEEKKGNSLENQTQLRHYVEIGARGGVSSFVGNPKQGYFEPGYNAGFGFYYIMRSLNYHVGMRTGLAAEASQSRFKTTNGYSDIFTTVDGNGEPIEVTYDIQRLDETHTQVYFSIPLQFSVFGENLAFHIGPTFALPLADFSNQVLYNSTLSCYYPLSGVRVENDPLMAAGFQEQQTMSIRHDKILPKVWVLASAELTYDVEFNGHYAMCFGLYADYALNSFTVEKSSNPSLMYLVPAEEGSTTLVRKTDSALRANLNGNQMVDKFSYFSAGFKVAFKMFD